MEVIHTSPTTESFVPLSTHQSQTPESFFSGPPVLYHHSPAATLKTHASELVTAPTLHSLFDLSQAPVNGTAAVNAYPHDAEEEHVVEAQGVDIWVSSERLVLFSPSKRAGLSIPYPSISLHAIQSSTPPSLFLQLVTQSSTFDDHDPDATVSLIITPTAAPTDPPVLDSTETTAPQPSPAQLFYTALSDCANLHPDPASPGSGEEDGGAQPNIIFEGDAQAPFSTLNSTADGQQTALPPAMPGSGGWITAENVNEYFDEEGNWRGAGEGLGEGAGSVRRREEDDGEVNGHGGAEEIEGEETKWRRTD